MASRPVYNEAMYHSQNPQGPTQMNNGLNGDYTVGTINPATLNPAMLAGVAPQQMTNSSPRGIKRSHTPDQSYNGQISEYNEGEDRRKRGRPQKMGSDDMSPPLSAKPVMPVQQQDKTPQNQPPALPSPVSAPQASPPKPTPTKTTVVKALPTVRDHTTDQLNPEGDEYIPREMDDAGERKVDFMGNLLGGREYRCRTFLVPNRGQKLFMLATECARVLSYRDSYLLFNKNRSLFKIIATQAEKDDLIQQDILPYSYRSRQIAIVTARSMFRQFGSRMIKDGRRVRDDYWEGKARKQGFTEEDLAGEKRPGAAKLRAAQQQEAAANSLGHNSEIIYSHDASHLEGHPPPGVHLGINSNITPLPMINSLPDDRMKELNMVPRPRQEITGAPYQDRIQPTPPAEVLTHAQSSADYNKMLGQSRKARVNNFDDYYKEPRMPPVSQMQNAQDQAGGVSQPLPSPQVVAPMAGGQPPMLQPSHASMMSPRAYSQTQHAQSLPAQSPIRQMHPQQANIRSDQLLQQRSPVHPQAMTAAQNSYNPYANQSRSAQPSPMWPPPQASVQHMPQYAHPQQHQQAQQQQQPQAAQGGQQQHHQQAQQHQQQQVQQQQQQQAQQQQQTAQHQQHQQQQNPPQLPPAQMPMYTNQISPMQGGYGAQMYQPNNQHYLPPQQHTQAGMQNWRPPTQQPGQPQSQQWWAGQS